MHTARMGENRPREPETNKERNKENIRTRQEHEERVREQEAKAREEKIYKLLSNQKRKENSKSNVSQETK
ncbi:hypothetical protein [Companilactobacillus furfuricola]|uniref:hypothetical protein n=1 Tax=Companilactobacillus furfuricola TaxID=1462575 RepID=UPI000F781127|nr:hypothetical protein [Companilactobacillus furfuricola]